MITMSAAQGSKLLDRFRMTAEDRDRFYEFLDAQPERDRVRYVFSGSKSSVWQKLGGGTSHVIGIFHPDRLVLSTRGMVRVGSEKRRVEYPIHEIDDIDVRSGPLFSSVTIRLRDGTTTKVGNVDNAVARPLAEFPTRGAAVFDRARGDLKLFNAMYYSYVLAGLPLPAHDEHHGRAAA